MTDITPEHEVKMRVACQALVGLHIERTDPLESFGSRVMVRQYLDVVQPELVLMLLDMGNQMTQAVEKIDALVKAAGFDNLKNVTELACEWKQHAFVSRVASRLAVGDRVFSRDAKDEALAYAKDNGLTITPIWDEDEKTYEQHMEHWYGPTA